jgi:hypothetical protein
LIHRHFRRLICPFLTLGLARGGGGGGGGGEEEEEEEEETAWKGTRERRQIRGRRNGKHKQQHQNYV